MLVPSVSGNVTGYALSTVSGFGSASSMIGGFPLAPIPTIIFKAIPRITIPIPDTKSAATNETTFVFLTDAI